MPTMSDAVAVHDRARRWRLLLLLVLVGALVGLLVAATTPPVYTATSRSFVSVRSPSSVSDLQQGGTFAEQVGRSYASLATTPYLLEQVVRDLHLATTPGALSRRITARTPQDTALLDIDVTDASPARAARIANAVQQRLGTTAASLAPSGEQHPALTAVQPAVPPTGPSSPNAPTDVVVGALGGAAVWLLVVLIAAIRRRRPRAGSGLAAPSLL